MTSENFPRMPAPPSLTPHPGTVLPALALPTEVLHLGHDAEWQPHQPRVASVYPTSPPGCQPPVRKPTDCAEKTESQCLCVWEKGKSQCEPTRPNGRRQRSAWNHSGPDLRSWQSLSGSSLHWPDMTNQMALSITWSSQHFIPSMFQGLMKGAITSLRSASVQWPKIWLPCIQAPSQSPGLCSFPGGRLFFFFFPRIEHWFLKQPL